MNKEYKVAVVTDGGSGIGRGTALALAKNGYRVSVAGAVISAALTSSYSGTMPARRAASPMRLTVFATMLRNSIEVLPTGVNPRLMNRF